MSDNWIGVPAPPSTDERAGPVEPARSIYTFSEVEIAEYLLLCLERVKRLPNLGEHPDGSPAIKSPIGVWLTSQVGGLLKRKRLINLSSLSREQRLKLRSIAGVASLVRQALTEIQAAGTARGLG